MKEPAMSDTSAVHHSQRAGVHPYEKTKFFNVQPSTENTLHVYLKGEKYRDYSLNRRVVFIEFREDGASRDEDILSTLGISAEQAYGEVEFIIKEFETRKEALLYMKKLKKLKKKIYAEMRENGAFMDATE